MELKKRIGVIVVSTVVLALVGTINLQGQSFWFGPKGGINIASQRWVNFQPNYLFTYNADFFVESYDEEHMNAVFASLGYRGRGSSIRTFTWLGESIGRQGFKFNNIVLELGAKRAIKESVNYQPYYNIGLRAEYTLRTNLDVYERFNSAFYPNKAFVNNWVAGASRGGGIEMMRFSELIHPILELALNQDFTFQYFQPTINNVVDQTPGNFGNLITLRETAIRNLTLELKLGFKFLRKVEYY